VLKIRRRNHPTIDQVVKTAIVAAPKKVSSNQSRETERLKHVLTMFRTKASQEEASHAGSVVGDEIPLDLVWPAQRSDRAASSRSVDRERK
jgi:hypothetical protein